MRAFLTLTALLVGFNAPAQTTFWNPDADGNGLVGAADLLPFLEVFGGSYSATPLYCQDTSSFTAIFTVDIDEIAAPLVPLIFAIYESGGATTSQHVFLPTDSVQNGYRTTVVNLNIHGQGGGGVWVQPENDIINIPKVTKGKSREFIHHDGQWYPTFAE